MGSTTNQNAGAVPSTEEAPTCSKTPVADAFRAFLASATPEQKQEFCDQVNGFAGGLRAVHENKEEENEQPDLKDGFVDFATFQRVELRTGTVTGAYELPKSDKLLKLMVSFGSEGSRTILAGIAKSYTVENIVGMSVIAVCNLPPRKMMGQVSHGMLVAAQSEDGRVILASCPGVPDGSRLG
jgi:methionine--tRNA ligase beta chain